MKTLFLSIIFLGSLAFASTPTEVCKKLTAAAQANNFKEYTDLTTDYGGNPHAPHYKGEKSFDKMHTAYLDKIKGINCGTEHVAGDHAFVEADSQGKKRLIPFVQENGNWKFDASTYMSFYEFRGPGAHMMHK